MTPPLELDRHLAQTCWHLVAHRCELSRDRDYLRFPWILGDLVLYNDKGDIIAFDNLCPHRGTRFFLEAAGSGPVLCPYHGWSYRGGEMRIPRREAYDAVDLEKVALRRFSVAWCGDFLFAAVAPQSGLASQLGDTWPTLAGISRNIDRRRDFNQFIYQCPWRVAVENALEPDHVAMVHKGTLASLGLSTGINTYSGVNSSLHAEITNERTRRTLQSMRRFLDIDYQYEGYLALFIFPFTFLTSTFGYSYALQNFLPSSTCNQTTFSSRLLTVRTAGDAAERIVAAFFGSVAEVNRQVFAEDHEICSRIDPAFPLHRPDRIFSATEEKVRHFRDSLARMSHERQERSEAPCRPA